MQIQGMTKLKTKQRIKKYKIDEGIQYNALVNLTKQRIKKYKIDEGIQYNALVNLTKQNYIVILAGFICLYFLSKKKSISIVIYSSIVVSFFGFFIHWLRHKLPPTHEWFFCHDNWITRNPVLNLILDYLGKILDFHSEFHHDSTQNKLPINLWYEFWNNLLTQAGFLWILKTLLSKVDNGIILLWGLVYSTVHIFNYSWFQPVPHMQHHLDNQTNHGTEVYDIIFGTKYDWTNIEYGNHAAVNMSCLTALIYRFC